MNSILVRVEVKAPMPLMHPRAAERFNQLREIIKTRAGFDFLAICGDICRAANFVSNKDGVANRSWHKTGRAFDYNQDDQRLVICSEMVNGKQFFRTFLRCTKQDGSQGEFRNLQDYRGGKCSGYYCDFTDAAESVGFKRIPAWNGWQRNYNRREFWHYQFDEGLAWADAMAQLNKRVSSESEQTAIEANNRILGLNDRGEAVRAMQRELARLGFLPATEADGVFGAVTKSAVIAFQRKNNIAADGLIGSQTRAKILAQTQK